MSERFEKQVKQLLDDIQLEPRTDIWENVKQTIQPEKRNHRFIFWWLLPVIFLAAAGTHLLINNNSVDKQVTEIETNQAPSKNKDARPAMAQSIAHNKDSEEKAAIITKQRPAPSPKIQRQSPVASKQKQQEQTSRDVSHEFVSSVAVKNNAPSFVLRPVQQNVANEPNNSSKPKAETTPDTEPTGILENDMPVVRAPGASAAHDTANAFVDPSLTKAPLKTSKWSFGITADIGVTTAAGPSSGKPLTNPVFSSGSSGPTSGLSNAMAYQHVTASARASFGLYVTAHRKINNALSLQSSLGYTQSSFSILSATIKDSLMSGSYVSSPVSRSGADYRFSYLNMYIGAAYHIIKVNELQFKLAAGIDNQLLIGGKRLKRNESFLNNSFSLQDKSNLINDYRRWQPLIRLSLAADINSGKTRWLQLSPYFNYGLRTFEKHPSTPKRHLSSFGISGTYFFR